MRRKKKKKKKNVVKDQVWSTTTKIQNDTVSRRVFVIAMPKMGTVTNPNRTAIAGLQEATNRGLVNGANGDGAKALHIINGMVKLPRRGTVGQPSCQRSMDPRTTAKRHQWHDHKFNHTYNKAKVNGNKVFTSE